MIFIILALMEPAYAFNSVKVSIDGAAYSCRPDGEMEALPSPDAAVGASLSSTIDIECLKLNRTQKPSASLYQIEKWAMQLCRTKILTPEACQVIATKPNTTCATTVEGWFPSLGAYQRTMIANFCRTQIYQCK